MKFIFIIYLMDFLEFNFLLINYIIHNYFGY